MHDRVVQIDPRQVHRRLGRRHVRAPRLDRDLGAFHVLGAGLQRRAGGRHVGLRLRQRRARAFDGAFGRDPALPQFGRPRGGGLRRGKRRLGRLHARLARLDQRAGGIDRLLGDRDARARPFQCRFGLFKPVGRLPVVQPHDHVAAPHRLEILHLDRHDIARDLRRKRGDAAPDGRVLGHRQARGERGQLPGVKDRQHADRPQHEDDEGRDCLACHGVTCGGLELAGGAVAGAAAPAIRSRSMCRTRMIAAPAAASAVSRKASL